MTPITPHSRRRDTGSTVLPLRGDDGSLYALKSYRDRTEGRLKLRNEVKWLTYCTSRVPAPGVFCWSDTAEWLIMDYVAGDSVYDLVEVETPHRLGTRLGRWLGSFHALGPFTNVSFHLTPSLIELYDRACEETLFCRGVGERFCRLRQEIADVIPSEGITTQTILKSDCQLFHFIVAGDIIFGIDFEEAGALGDSAIDLGQLAASYVSVAPAGSWKPFRQSGRTGGYERPNCYRNYDLTLGCSRRQLGPATGKST